jgi:hypothetical protein
MLLARQSHEGFMVSYERFPTVLRESQQITVSNPFRGGLARERLRCPSKRSIQMPRFGMKLSPRIVEPLPSTHVCASGPKRKVPPKQSATQTLTSGKNEIMRILVFGEQWSNFSAWFAFDHGAGDVLSFSFLAIRVFERPENQRPHGCTRLSGAVAQRRVQWLGNIYRRSNRHDLIMVRLT